MDNEFLIKLKRGPSFLLLGQDTLRKETGHDPLLTEISRKYGDGQQIDDYNELIKLFNNLIQNNYDEKESILAWMQQRCERFTSPSWLNYIAKFKWNGVYTSCIDSFWFKSFRNDWREFQSIYNDSYSPENPRNRLRLHSTFLFGSVNRMDDSERSPLSKIELIKRKPIATSLARRLKELITPLGVLIIEGYSGSSDWFDPEMLYVSTSELNQQQVHIFSASDELVENEYIKLLLEEDKLVLHKESLFSFLSYSHENGYIDLNDNSNEEFKHSIQIGDSVYGIPASIWNQTSKSATILTDSLFLPPEPISDEKKYSEFRKFLSESSIKPIWSGYNKGYSFVRNFEDDLYKVVMSSLEDKQLQNDPIILHGQTGTGKTVALGSVAYRVREEKEYPVLFIERKSQRPSNNDLEAFCKWSEDSGAKTCLIIWDGMTEVGQYYSLLSYLVSRGRKVVIVGSSYKLGEVGHLKNYINAPSQLEIGEQSNFLTFLNKFDPSLGLVLENQIKTNDPNFLVCLYRLLPVTRNHIRIGLNKEVENAERQMRIQVEEGEIEAKSTTLAYALLRSGVISKKDLAFNADDKDEIGGEQFDQLQKLIGLIMVPGKYGIRIPLEILLRTLDKSYLEGFNDIFNRTDIFKYYEDMVGNILVGPRHPLEAKLLTQYRLGGSKYEIDFIKQLLLEVRDNDFGQDSYEIQFAVDLIRCVGPNGEDSSYYAPYFLELSKTLTKLREERGVINPRLMLQEATLLREWVVKSNGNVGNKNNYDELELLNEAERIIKKALDYVHDDKYYYPLKSAIIVEHSSIIGSQIQHYINNNQTSSNLRTLYKEARDLIYKAKQLDPNSYYPIDVFAWITRNLLLSDKLSPIDRLEAEVDIIHIFDLVNSDDIGINQKIRFEDRKMEIGKLLDDDEMSEEAFNNLVKQGSKVGYYRKAYQIIKDVPRDRRLTEVEISKCQEAVNYLESVKEKISNDGKCMYLLFRLWWMTKTGRPFFYEERQTLPFTKEDWMYCYRILTDLMETEDFYSTPSIKYFKGIVLFHLGYLNDSIQVFKELESESEFLYKSRRIIRSYLASNSNGNPIVYNGTVTFISNNWSKGDIYVEELRKKIRFDPKSFNKEINLHDELTFHIAFNFRSFIPDPINYYEIKRGKGNE